MLSIEDYFAIFEPEETQPEIEVLDELFNNMPDEFYFEVYDDLIIDEDIDYINQLFTQYANEQQQEREAGTNTGNQGESTQENANRTPQESVSEEQGTTDQQRRVITPSYTNGDTVTYKGKQYIVNAFGKDGDGNAVYDPEQDGNTVFEDVAESELGGEMEQQSEDVADNKNITNIVEQNKDNGIHQSISQGEHGEQNTGTQRTEEIIPEWKRRSEEALRDAQETSKSEQKELIERTIEQFAKESVLWIPFITVTDLGEPMPSGNENEVFLDKDGKPVIKVVNYEIYSNTPQIS